MSSLSKECFKQLYSSGTIMEIPKGHCFTTESYGTNSVYCLLDGICALIRYTKCGKEIIYYYFQEGDIIGCVRFHAVESKQDQPIHHTVNYHVYAKTDCTISRLSFNKVAELMDSNIEIARYFNFSLSNHYLSILNHLHSSKECDTTERLAHLLIELAIYKNGAYIVDKHFTYVEMAKYLGVHYVTVSCIMANFKQLGLITKSGHNTIIEDIKTLTTMASPANQGSENIIL